MTERQKAEMVRLERRRMYYRLTRAQQDKLRRLHERYAQEADEAEGSAAVGLVESTK